MNLIMQTLASLTFSLSVKFLICHLIINNSSCTTACTTILDQIAFCLKKKKHTDLCQPQ